MELYEYDYKKVENRYIKNIKSYEGQIDILENLVFIPKKDGNYPVNLTNKNFTIKVAQSMKNISKNMETMNMSPKRQDIVFISIEKPIGMAIADKD